MNAIILAGGRGTRLAPLTDLTPKPLLEVAGRPILDYVVGQLIRYGFREIVFTAGYLAEQIERRANQYKDIKAVCIAEKEALGTAGAVKNAEKYLGDTFVVMSGDCISDIDLSAMLAAHKRKNADITIASAAVKDPTLYGVISAGSDGRIIDFHEKPKDASFGTTVNAGVYVVSKRALSGIERGVFYDFSKQLFPKLLPLGGLYEYRHYGYWSDLGDFAGYYAAGAKFAGGYFYDLPAMEEYSLVR